MTRAGRRDLTGEVSVVDPLVGRSARASIHAVALGWLPRLPESLAELDLLLLTVAAPRKVQHDGIHLFGLRYFSITQAAFVGELVTIRYDPCKSP